MRIARLFVWLGVSSCVGAALAEDRQPAPAYTNADLERVAPLRDETGVGSTPAFEGAPAPEPAASRRPARGGRSQTEAGSSTLGESYWRREAEKAAERVRALRATADELRAQIEERKRPRPGSRTSKRGRAGADTGVAGLERRLAALEQRIRDTESQLEDRARRAGALPGWLR